MSYARLSRRPLLFKSFTGLEITEFDILSKEIESKYYDTIIAATFSSTNMSNTVTHMLSFQDLSSQPTVTGTYYSTPSGVTAYKTSSYNSTEANSKLRMRKAFTVNNFATFVTGGGGGTLNSRKNGANGNITVNLNVGSAQLVQDTTHLDNLAVGDDFDWQFSDTGTNYSYDFYSCDFTSTNGDCIFACATDDPITSINTSVTAYYGLAGSLDTLQWTETNVQVTVNNAFKSLNLHVMLHQTLLQIPRPSIYGPMLEILVSLFP
ncbi:MAG: hypothetical protein WAM14_26840 [Candidatus Nitrosopolaris sp.]